jgi:hypothetical protein
MDTSVTALHPEKRVVLTLVQSPINATLVILVYALGNAELSRVTHRGMDTSVTELQFPKALRPTLVTVAGISMLVGTLHPKKAPPPILVTPDGISMLASALHPLKAE